MLVEEHPDRTTPSSAALMIAARRWLTLLLPSTLPPPGRTRGYRWTIDLTVRDRQCGDRTTRRPAPRRWPAAPSPISRSPVQQRPSTDASVHRKQGLTKLARLEGRVFRDAEPREPGGPKVRS